LFDDGRCRKELAITVMARLAHIISHGIKIMVTNRRIPAVFAGLVNGGIGITSGSAGDTVRNLREREYSKWKNAGVVTPLPYRNKLDIALGARSPKR